MFLLIKFQTTYVGEINFAKVFVVRLETLRRKMQIGTVRELINYVLWFEN